MPAEIERESARKDHARVKNFLDCIAQLMARRWIREQRHNDVQSKSQKTDRQAPATEDFKPERHVES